MKKMGRREFLDRSSKSAIGLGAVTVLANPKSVRAAPANEKLNLAIVDDAEAAALLKRAYRKPWVVEEEV